MKRIYLILNLLLCFISTIEAKEKVVFRPPFIAWNSNHLEIDKIKLNDTATIVYFRAFDHPGNKIKIATGSYLKDEKGNLYPIRRGSGIQLDQPIQMPQSGETKFQLIFKPIPFGTTEVSFSEGDFDGALKIWGIQLNRKNNPKLIITRSLRVIKPNKDFDLPIPELKYGKAILKARILHYRKDMFGKVIIRLNDPVRGIENGKYYRVENDGSFKMEKPVLTVTPATIITPFGQINCWLAPGEETHILINLMEYTRRQSRLNKDSKPIGRKVYYSGYLAGVQQELSDTQIPATLDYFFKDHTIETLKIEEASNGQEYLLARRAKLISQIKKASISKAAKTVLSVTTDILFTQSLYLAEGMIIKNHLMNQELAPQTAKEDDSKRFIIPSDFFNIIKQCPTINTDLALYVDTYSYCLYNIKQANTPITNILETNKGIFFDMIAASKIYESIRNFTPITDNQRNELKKLSSPAYSEMIEDENEELLRKIERNKKKKGFTIHEIGDIDPTQVFHAITEPYKGSALLVDFWATWCGPCRIANAKIHPLKEKLKDKDLIYIYITGETSPKALWENMIPDLHGEHYRLSNHQWRSLIEQLNIQGIPTYLILDKNGKTTYRQTGFPGLEVMEAELLKVLNN